MKVITSLQLLLLTLGSTSVVSGLRERPFDNITWRGICKARCVQFENCVDQCLTELPEITRLDAETEANLTYACDTEYGLGLETNPGVFLLELRNQSSDWDWIGMSSGNNAATVYLGANLLAGRYQYRLTRALATGIARPETTKWYIVSKRTKLQPHIADAELLTHPLDMWIECLELDNGSYSYYSTASVQLGFRFADEYFSCFYKLRCESDDGKYNETIQNSFLDSREPTFRGLPLGGNFTISMQPIKHGFFDNQTLIKFSTPSHWSNDARSRICVPDETKGLNTTVNLNKMKNVYDVAITWKRPDYIPDFFIVNITLNGTESTGSSQTFHNVSGSDTATVFRGVQILDQYNVSIRAWSWLGGGPETSRSFPLRIDSSGAGTLVIPGMLAWMIFIATVAVSYG